MALTLDSVSGFVINLIIMVFSIVLILAAATGAFLWVKAQKRWKEFKCVIWERDGFGQLKQSFDNAGVFVDSKTKNKRLFLKRNKVGLNPDQLPYIQSKKVRTLYLLRTGLKNFHYINLDIQEPAVTLTVGEEDVNWAINSYDKQKKLFTQGMLMQLMPFITIAFVTIIILIIFIYFFRQFTVLGDMAIALEKAAQAIAQARAGTVIIPS